MQDFSQFSRLFGADATVHLAQQAQEEAAAEEEATAASPGPDGTSDTSVAAPEADAIWYQDLPSLILGGATIMIAVFCLIILYLVVRGRIDMTRLLSEADGKASLSRAQAFIFTIVLAGSMLSNVAATGQFVDEVPLWVLFMMGGSFGTYLASKGIEMNANPNPTTPAPDDGTG